MESNKLQPQVIDMNEQRLKAMDAVSDYSRVVNTILKTLTVENESLKKENEILKKDIERLKGENPKRVITAPKRDAA